MTVPDNFIDLRSDTVTRPTRAMREAMARAEVGDDVMGEDPSVNELQRRAAELMGKEAALFVPSGTMANLLAVLSQTRHGDTVILSETAHPYKYESGNLAMVAGVLTRTIPCQYGLLSAEQVGANIIQTGDHHFSQTTMVMLENTSNCGGGTVYPIETVRAIAKLAEDRGLKRHCDGARIFNAAASSGVSVAEYAAHADTISFCLSKGLGAPAGSLLAGNAETIDKAHRYRKMLGGGMRQAGVLAAAGLYALDHNVARLSEDHRRAAAFRAGLEGTGRFEFPFPSPTNMVYVNAPDAEAFAQRLAGLGVRVGASGGSVRAVFHLDVSDEDVERAIAAFDEAL